MPLALFPVYRFFCATTSFCSFDVRLSVSIVTGGSATTCILKLDTDLVKPSYKDGVSNPIFLMTGPIVGGGDLIGTVHFARGSGTPAFDASDLADLGAICSHLSASLATIRAKSAERCNSVLSDRLTKRELQIASLVARGLTNAEIGAELWIAPNSVKQALK